MGHKLPRAPTATTPLIDHLVGAGEQHRRDSEAQRLRGLQMTNSNLVGCVTGQSAALAP